ncbi:MAG: acyl transferase [Pyrinomonadaceae bacterium]|nr:acyl transferase [Sphingobacteriaceae bacterium]
MVDIPSQDTLFSIQSAEELQNAALHIFRYQASENTVYRRFIKELDLKVDTVETLSDIPFLPIDFFKNHQIICGDEQPEIVFSSSGTSGASQSQHHVKDLSFYTTSFRKSFKHFYGDIKEYTLLALLPSYQEREGSSLIYMIDHLIKESECTLSGYFLYNHDELFDVLTRLKKDNKKAILMGVTYALLDFVEHFQIIFPNLIVMETGGMKGKRKEMIREELHEVLCRGFGATAIHSEYGMTELLSQAYSGGNGKFNCPPWMKVSIRDINDPLTLLAPGFAGGINVIDLANLHSCSFIASQDLGKLFNDGTFEVLGRFDNSDIRGCNLLI